MKPVTANPDFSHAALDEEQARRCRSISVVVPCYNEAANLDRLLPRLITALVALGLQWEILLIDDGSRDDTARELTRWSQRVPGVRALLLSRNFGKEAALSAGLDHTAGDVVVLMDADLQHEPELIAPMLLRWQAGIDVVYARRKDRSDEPLYKRAFTRLFYRLLNATSRRVHVPADAGDFRLMDHKVVMALRALPEHNRFLKGMYAWVGFRSEELPYMPAARTAGRSSYNLHNLISLSLNGMTSFTTWPLRASSVLGMVMAALGFLYGLYLIVSYRLFGSQVSGWTTIMVSLMLFCGVQLVSLGIVGEYLARVYEEVKRRPLYVVRDSLGQGLGSAVTSTPGTPTSGS
ncbi:glycosyltransferase family 2 protein [Sphaerotilus hippei]|uniref:glycosyltransferase family 2 protein n=1 Tax=Sphaerotilus hippei TaxID=744406 RepID=UPI001FEA6D4D|nr:glycosyltransferase family 2 protein [Sphaerotilus hippei]